ncbi:hypothetical protein U1Q18_033801 [Sarracenia purpurea var. burkii]
MWEWPFVSSGSLSVHQRTHNWSMSSRGLRGPLRGYVRSTRRKMVLEVEINVPSRENPAQEGSSSHSNSQCVQAGQQGEFVLPAPIDVEAFDDDIVISSPRSFAEAKNNSRRSRGSTIVVDVDSEERTYMVGPNYPKQRRRVPSNQAFINCDLLINLEGSSNAMRENVRSLEPSPSSSPPKEPTFNCPVCMGPLIEETSTKCGHIFCKSCIKTAIAAQGKCPTCRRKVTMKTTHRVYLPAAK